MKSIILILLVLFLGCEEHYLDFDSVKLEEVEGLEFDVSNSVTFERVDGYGIRLHAINGHPVSIPGYGYNNGDYSESIDLQLLGSDGKVIASYDVSECQTVRG